MFNYVSRCNICVWCIDMSANIDVFSPPRTSTLKSKLEKRVEALEQDVTELTVLLQDLLRREELQACAAEWKH